MRYLTLSLLLAACATATPPAPTYHQCLFESPPGEEHLSFMEEDNRTPDCPQEYFACIKVSDTQALARNERRMREWIRYAWGHCGPR